MFALSPRRLGAASFAAVLASSLLPVAEAQTSPPVSVPVPASALGGGAPTAPAAGPAAPVPIASSGPTSTSVPIPVIMVFDDQRILETCKAVKSIQSQMDGLRQAAEKEFSQKQADFQQAQQDFQASARSNTIPADQLEEKRHSLQLRADQLQKEVDQRKQTLQQAFANSVDKVKQSLFEIIQGLAAERHANLILLRSAAIPLDRSYDVTPEALARLDGKLTSVTVTMPTASAGPATAAAATAPAPAKKK
jgi:Skp family chaperone for outer membrane proteins